MAINRQIVGKCPDCGNMVASGVFTTLGHCSNCGKDIDLNNQG